MPGEETAAGATPDGEVTLSTPDTPPDVGSTTDEPGVDAEPGTVSAADPTDLALDSTAEAEPEPDVITGGHEILRHRAVSSVRALVRFRAFLGQPAPRLGLAATLALSLLALAGVAGGYVVPHTAGHPVRQAIADPSDSGDPDLGEQFGEGLDPTEGAEPPDDLDEGDEDPGLGGDFGPGLPGVTTRPADALGGWALSMQAKTAIPSVALQAYGYAQLVLEGSTPTCHLSWTTLAGIGKVESNHGRTGGSSLTSDGKALPPIRGVPLNGNGHDAIPDTDHGTLDGDAQWDRAVGPMQFIPSTWQKYAVDADNDGVKDPNDIDDAALAAGTYLCAGGKNVSTAPGWYAAVLSYNAVRVYAGEVFAAANDYGRRSKN